MKRGLQVSLSFTLGLAALLLLLSVVAKQPPVSAAPSAPQAATRYVAPSGTDTGECTAQASPCKTIQYAVNQAQDGDEIAIATTDNLNEAVYTGAGDSVITVDKDVTLQGGYLYVHTTLPPTNKWTTGFVPAKVDGEGARRGITINGGSPVVKLLAFVNGQAEQGGNVYAENAHPKFVGTPILSGTATYGGGIYLNKCTVEFDPGDVDWGVISQFSGLMLIAHNQAQYGGGLYVNGGTPTLSTLAIYSNTASANGGGVYFDGGHPYLLGGIIQENVAGGNGGGFYFDDSAPRVAGTSVLSNVAQAGGGFYLNGPFAFTEANVPIIANSYVRFNRTSGDGGGFYFRQSIAGLANNVVADNRANNGAAMYLWASSPQVYHNTIAQDKGSTAVYLTEKPGSVWPPVVPIPSQPSFTNTILVSQTTAVYVNSTGLAAPLQNKITLQGTLWWGNDSDTSGSGEIVHTTDVYSTPQFICTGRPPDCLRPYHIMTDSAAVDSGMIVNIQIPGSDLFVDIDGQLRPSGDGYDIGADEVVSDAYSVWLIPPVSTLGIKPGETVTHTHRLLNSGRETDTYTITFHTSNGWGRIVASPTITLGTQMSTTIQVIVTVPPTATQAMSETDVISVTSHNRPNRRTHALDYTRVLTGEMADLSVSKTADHQQVLPGEAVAYTLQITKTGTLTRSVAVTLHDTLVPTRAVAGWQLPSGCIGNEATRRITCTFSMAGSPEVVTRNLSIAITTTNPYSGVLLNTAIVVGDVLESTPRDNVSEAVVGIRTTPIEPTVDLAVSKTADRPQVTPGGQVAYSLRITKTGTLSSSVVVTLHDTLVPTRAVTGWQLPSGCSGNEATRRITCTFTMAGTPEVITQDFHVVVTTTNPYTGVLFNTATVVGNVRDNHPLNNVDTANVTIRATACNVPQSVTLAGPHEVTVDSLAMFTATVHMLSDTAILPPLQPFTYTWQATDQTTQTHVVSAIIDTITYTWHVTGSGKTISVQVLNPCGAVSSKPYTLTITPSTEKHHRIYLPLVLRNKL